MDPNKSEYVIERRPYDYCMVYRKVSYYKLEMLRLFFSPIANLSNLSNQDSMFKYNRPATNNNASIIKSNRRPTYAQWITKAIAESPSKAITLADINEWMIRNVPGLQEQRYLHSCKGWKVSSFFIPYYSVKCDNKTTFVKEVFQPCFMILFLCAMVYSVQRMVYKISSS